MSDADLFIGTNYCTMLGMLEKVPEMVNSHFLIQKNSLR